MEKDFAKEFLAMMVEIAEKNKEQIIVENTPQFKKPQLVKSCKKKNKKFIN